MQQALAAGNTINASTGAVTYVAGWTGTSTITVSATGCGISLTSTHNAITALLADQTVTASPAAVCNNTSSVITVGSTETGVNYTLRDNSNNNIIAGPTAGTGAPINFNTGNLSASKTYNVLSEISANSGVLMFDGSNDHVFIPNNANLNPTRITLECWVKLQSYENLAEIIVKSDINKTNGYGLILNSTGNKFAFYYNGYPNGLVTSSTTAVLNTWYHVAATFDGFQTRIYVNGVLENTVLDLGTISSTTENIELGGSRTAGSYMMQGMMDEARIWNKALTATQIQTNMNSYLVGNEPGPAAYYQFEDGTGSSTLTDIAGSDNNGALTNMNTATAWATRSYIQCSSQLTTTPTVTVLGNVTTPVFAAGPSTTRCQGPGTITYTATASNDTSLIYSLNAASMAGGNTINTATGEVTYIATWSGTTTITATAFGCGGPRTRTFVVTVTGTVGTPVFALGATSTRCQAAANVTYTATSSNNTGITYSLDAASL